MCREVMETLKDLNIDGSFGGGPNTKVVHYIETIKEIVKERKHWLDRLQLTTLLLYRCDQVAQIDLLATNNSLTPYYIIE